MELFKITAQSIYERWENLLSRVEKFLDRIDDIQREVQRKSKEAWNAFSLNFIWESGFFENLANFFGFEKYNPPGAGYVEYGAPYPMTQEEAARGEAWNKINKFWEKQDARADKIYAKIEEIIKLFSISPIIWARDLQIMQKSFGEFAIGKGIGMGFPGTQLLTSTEILAGFGGLRKALQDPLPAEKVSELWENAIKNIEADFAKGWAKFMAGAEIDFDQLIEGMLLHLSTALITDIWKKPMLGGRLPGKWGDWLTIGGGAYGAYQAGGWEQGAITGGVTGLSSGGGIWGAVIGAIAGGMLGEMGKKERRGSSPLILAYEEAMQEIEQATTNAISNAFIASLETGEFFTFTQELKKGLYENIVIAFTDAFARGGLIGQGIGQVMENIIKRIQYTITEEEARIMAMQVAPYPGKMRDELTKIFLQQHLREGLPTAEEAQEIALYATEQMEKLGETMEAMRPVWEAVEKGLKDLNVTMGLSLETQLEEIEINKAYIDSVQDYIRTLRFGGNMPFDIVSLQAEFGRLAGGAGTMEGLSTFLGFLQGQYMPIMQSYAMDYPAIVEQVISFLENLEEIKKTEIEDILNDIYDALGTKGAIVDQLKELGLEIGTHFDAFDIKYPAELIAPKIPAPVINLTVKIEDGQVTAEVDEGTVITEPSPTPAPPLTPNINAIYSVGNYQYQYGYLVGSFGRVSSPRVAQAKRQFQQEGWGSIPWPH